ncbi:MAG TPA: O-antigen ligase domain-containing protein [Bacteroidetes bacterium]|nr:O-antigen ligase domain-containing protein [Bacteroidota bacterium]
MIVLSEPVHNKNALVIPYILRKLAWWSIVFLLGFLPFQLVIQKAFDLPRHFLWIDELLILFSFIIIFFGLFCYKIKMKKRAALLFVLLIFIVFVGVISALYNESPFVISCGAIFNYIKYFLVIPIFWSFLIPKNGVKGLYDILNKLALILCIIALFQELFYFLQLPVEKVGASTEYQYLRFGFMRTPSLMGHPNVFGLYSLLFFVLDFSLYRRLRWQNVLLLSGIFLSGSRIACGALFLIFFYFLYRKTSKMIRPALVLIIISLATTFLFLYLTKTKEFTSERYFRRDIIIKSIEIWKNHPLMGVGPGMYGGWITEGYNSPVFEKYNFEPRWIKNINRHRTLDNFWFQNLAETGLLGTACFIAILLSLWKFSLREMLLEHDPFRKAMLSGLNAMLIAMVVHLFTTSLNATAFLITYFMLFGMVLGMKSENFARQ